MRYRLVFLTAAILALPHLYAEDQAAPKPIIMEGLPDPLQAKRDLWIQSSANSGIAPRYFIKKVNQWIPGQVIRVAFSGGNAALRQDIAATASQWTAFGNIKFDFGPPGQFYEWTNQDQSYSAEIRVAFVHGGQYGGYWSLIGTDSIQPALSKPNEASLNLDGFDVSRPSDWSGVVLHEFGHALGFMHEHQSPAGGCDSEFNWYGDPLYDITADMYGQLKTDANDRSPGVYRFLAGPLNGWPTAKTDFNMRSLPNSTAYDMGAFDSHSIMMYSFDQSFFTNGTHSKCYTAENLTLSPGDQAGVALLYPKDQAKADALKRETNSAFQTLSESPMLSNTVKKQLKDLQIEMQAIPIH